jgi:hypothetical protein
MFTTLRQFNELYTVSTPIQGTFGDFIGTASINDTYTVKVMLKTDTLNITNNKRTTSYKFI